MKFRSSSVAHCIRRSALWFIDSAISRPNTNIPSPLKQNRTYQPFSFWDGTFPTFLHHFLLHLAICLRHLCIQPSVRTHHSVLLSRHWGLRSFMSLLLFRLWVGLSLVRMPLSPVWLLRLHNLHINRHVMFRMTLNTFTPLLHIWALCIFFWVNLIPSRKQIDWQSTQCYIQQCVELNKLLYNKYFYTYRDLRISYISLP